MKQHHLTISSSAVTLTAPHSSGAGRENPFEVGEKIAAALSGFFMSSHKHGALLCHSFYGGILWAAFGLAAPTRGILTPFNPVTHAVRSMSGGLPFSRVGITA